MPATTLASELNVGANRSRGLASPGLFIAHKNIETTNGTNLYTTLAGGTGHTNVVPFDISAGGFRTLTPVWIAVVDETSGVCTVVNAIDEDAVIQIYGRVRQPLTGRLWPQDILAAANCNSLATYGLWIPLAKLIVQTDAAIINTTVRSDQGGGLKLKASGDTRATLIQTATINGFTSGASPDKTEWLAGCDMVVAVVENATSPTPVADSGTVTLERCMLGFIPAI